MNILIADSFPASHAATLEQMGHQCTSSPNLDADSLPGAVDGHEVLIVRSTKVNPDTLDAGKDLKLVIRAGAGTNTIDKKYASEKGIRVCNVPGANAIAVAELAMGLITPPRDPIPHIYGGMLQRSRERKIVKTMLPKGRVR